MKTFMKRLLWQPCWLAVIFIGMTKGKPMENGEFNARVVQSQSRLNAFGDKRID